jgi:gas vesicle protein
MANRYLAQPKLRLQLIVMEGIMMRVSTFLLGGIAGAAAVIYLNRKSKSMLFSAFSSSSNSMSKLMDNSKDNMSGKSSQNAAKSTAFNATNNLSQVENMIKEDPSLKHKVNEILSDNHENTQTIQ